MEEKEKNLNQTNKTKKTKQTSKSDAKPVKKTKKSDKEIINELKEEIQNQKNNYLSSLADLENDRKRFEKSKSDFIKFSNDKVLVELINILDTFNMAMSIKNPSDDVKNFLIGFQIIANQFTTLLNNNGVTVIETKPGDKFNSEIHSSVEEVKSDEFKSGEIIFVLQKGYKIHERLLRPAMVKTAK